jgi:ribonuclease P protein component
MTMNDRGWTNNTFFIHRPSSIVHRPAFMDRPSRLRTNSDFQRVRRDGRSWATPWVVLVAAPNGLERSRFGFAVGKKIGKAVTRNRVKRRLREVVRQQRDRVAPGWDLIFIARDALQTATFEQLDQTVAQLLKRARVSQLPAGGPGREVSRPEPDPLL